MKRNLRSNAVQCLKKKEERNEKKKSVSAAYLKECEAEVILEQDTANAPHVTGLGPTQFCTETCIHTTT